MISVVIPVYNEENAITNTIQDLRTVLDKAFKEYEIIVVDDGSTDGTREKLEKFKMKNLVPVYHIENSGYGKSLLDGIIAAKYNCIAIIDGDGSYAPKDIETLYSYFPQYDMVVGARTGSEYQRGLWKRPARTFFKMFAEYASGRNIPDVNSGLRIFKKDIILKFRDSLCVGFSFTTTCTLVFMLNHYYVKYVPVSYLKREGKSKIKYWRDTLRAGQIIVEAILFYNPIKLFLLLAVCNALLGAVIGAVNCIFLKTAILSMVAAMCMASFVPIFCAGLIAGQLKKIYAERKA